MPQILKDEVKERIISAAVKVFKENIYSKASMKSVAEYADISVGNIYRYFSCKEDLYNEIVRELGDSVVEIIDKLKSGNDIHSIFRNFEETIDEFILLSVKNKEVIEILLLNKGNGTYNVEKHITDVLTEKLYNISSEICRNNILTDEDIKVLCRTNAAAIAAGVNNIMIYDGNEDTLKKRLKIFLGMMKTGIIENMKSNS